MKKMKNNLVYRSVGTFDAVQDVDSRTIRGTAIVFDSLSRVMRDEKGNSFVEKVSRDAINEDFLAMQDITMNIDHDNSRLLARYNHGEGTLRLFLLEDGLHFEFDAPTTSLGDEVLYNVRNGNLFECSFACYISRDNISRYVENGVNVHVIDKIDALVDCSIVVHAAYPATEVTARSVELAEKEAEEKAEQERIEQEKRNEQIIQSLKELKETFLSEINQN